ncbi:glycoside hydrolase superfamily [Xylaria sp. CBS 124048]|nr:glycoside hydrolase superfamily [Xylaria sp. CBS 124048]
MSLRRILAIVVWLISVPCTFAAYEPSDSNNVAVYWGQNSAGGANTQRQLIQVCESAKDVNVILLSFLTSPSNLNEGLNFAASARPTEQDIIACQTEHNKTLILSLGGAIADNAWAFADADQAGSVAKRIWDSFGPASQTEPSIIRPFGSASVDGFDLDFEAPFSNMHLFAQQLRTFMDQDTAVNGRKFYLSAAPQCPFPDANLVTVLHGDTATFLDFIFVQFYNNPSCDLRSTSGFQASLKEWNDGWAGSNGSKIFVGVPASASAIGPANVESFVDGSALAARYISVAQSFLNFAGVMIWDMSQVDSNPAFLSPIVSALGQNHIAPVANYSAVNSSWIHD